LFAIVEQEPREFPHLNQLPDNQKRTIRDWLSRLSNTADYKRGVDAQKAFVQNVINYLQLAEDDEKFRGSFIEDYTFLNIILGAADTCGDGMAH